VFISANLGVNGGAHFHHSYGKILGVGYLRAWPFSAGLAARTMLIYQSY